MSRLSGSLIALSLTAAPVSVPAEQARPVVIAHRGASGYLPEHTLEAVTLAHAMGADFIEQDIVLSKDDVPVVLHDVQIDTVTDVASRFPDRKRPDGRHYAIDFTLAELKQLRVTERFNEKTGEVALKNRFPQWRSAFQIPTLEEELELIQGLNHTLHRDAGIYPEIKRPSWHRKEGRDISRIVLPVLARYGFRTKEDNCWLQCFEYEETRRIRRELGFQGRIVQLLGAGKKGEDGTDFEFLRTRAGLEELARVADGIGPALGSVITGKTPEDRGVSRLVADAHAWKLVVHPYTVRADELPAWASSMDDALNMLFLEAQADGVFTDFPDLVAQWLRQRRTGSPRRTQTRH